MVRPLLKGLKDSSLTLVLLVLFLGSLLGQILFGFATHNEERGDRGERPIGSVIEYTNSPHFRASVFENWESEFLQMALFVFLTACLVQKGSSESNPPADEAPAEKKRARRYFRRHPRLRRLYENSLSLALAALFLLSFWLHAVASREQISEDRLRLGRAPVDAWAVLAEPEFWFESFQNWQSEFFSVALLGLLSIFLRQKNSPQSKDVDADHWETGSG